MALNPQEGRMADYRTAATDTGDVGLAIRQGLAVGFRQHLPGALERLLNVIVYMVPACAFLAFVHFVLGVGITATSIFGGLGVAGAGVPKFSQWLAGRRQHQKD